MAQAAKAQAAKASLGPRGTVYFQRHVQLGHRAAQTYDGTSATRASHRRRPASMTLSLFLWYTFAHGVHTVEAVEDSPIPQQWDRNEFNSPDYGIRRSLRAEVETTVLHENHKRMAACADVSTLKDYRAKLDYRTNDTCMVKDLHGNLMDHHTRC